MEQASRGPERQKQILNGLLSCGSVENCAVGDMAHMECGVKPPHSIGMPPGPYDKKLGYDAIRAGSGDASMTSAARWYAANICSRSMHSCCEDNWHNNACDDVSSMEIGVMVR